jgi:hypothetical protein
MMEEFGRMTFPNNRTASPLIDKDLVITRGITAAWGAYGPPGDRFYAFDKKSGELVWSSAPGALPQDNTFSHPWLSFLRGKRVLYSACGDSSLVCLNARTGEPLYRTSVAKAGAKGGINAAVVEYKGNIIVVHESENIDTTEVGAWQHSRSRPRSRRLRRRLRRNFPPRISSSGAIRSERWPVRRCSLATESIRSAGRAISQRSTPPMAGCCGKKSSASSSARAVRSTPMANFTSPCMCRGGRKGSRSGAGDAAGDGELFVVKPGEKDVEILSRTMLTGKCYGSPIGYNGKLYVQTEKKLYCFGKKGKNTGWLPRPSRRNGRRRAKRRCCRSCLTKSCSLPVKPATFKSARWMPMATPSKTRSIRSR